MLSPSLNLNSALILFFSLSSSFHVVNDFVGVEFGSDLDFDIELDSGLDLDVDIDVDLGDGVVVGFDLDS